MKDIVQMSGDACTALEEKNLRGGRHRVNEFDVRGGLCLRTRCWISAFGSDDRYIRRGQRRLTLHRNLQGCVACDVRLCKNIEVDNTDYLPSTVEALKWRADT